MQQLKKTMQHHNTNKNKKNFKNTRKLLGDQAMSKAPSQSAKAKILSASKDVDLPREIEYQLKNHHMC